MALIAVLKPLLKEKWGALHVHVPILATFNDDALIGRGSTCKPDTDPDATMPRRKQIWSASIPELCALCVAAGLGFEDAKNRVREIVPSDMAKTGRRHVPMATVALVEARSHRKPSRLDEAKKSLLSTRKSRATQALRSRAQVRQQKPYAFWLLRLGDPDWLETAFPGRRIEELPSVVADRALLGEVHPSLQEHLLGRPAFEAAVRAYYRDTQWLDARVCESEWKAIDGERQALLAKIESAHLQWQAAQQDAPRKSRFTLPRCATQIGISHSRLRYWCRRLLIPTVACEESMADFVSRCIDFGVQECESQGLTLSVTHVRRLSRIDSRYVSLVRSHIESRKAARNMDCQLYP
jgi:hypothetical protein